MFTYNKAWGRWADPTSLLDLEHKFTDLSSWTRQHSVPDLIPHLPHNLGNKRKQSTHPASPPYALIVWLHFVFPKLRWRQAFLKWLEPLNLLQMLVLGDIVSPEDIITCDILIGSGHSQAVGIYQAWGERLQKWLGWKLLLAWGCSLCNCCNSCWELFACVFYTLPAFRAAILFPLLEISLFC